MSDPTRGLPLASRPVAVVLWGAVVYSAVVALPALSLCWRHADEGGAVMFLWATLGAGFALPVGLAVGGLAAARERLVLQRHLPGRYTWLGHGIGAVGIAHWMAIAVFPVVAVFAGLLGSSGSSRYYRSAASGLIAWVAIAVGVAILWITWSAFKRRSLKPSALALPEIPHLIPSAALFAMLVAPVVLVGVGVVARAGDAGGYGFAGMFALGGFCLLAGLGLSWTGAHAEVVAARQGGPPARFRRVLLSYIGATLGLPAGLAFAIALFAPAWDGAIGQRLTVQLVSVFAISISLGLVTRRFAGMEPSRSAG